MSDEEVNKTRYLQLREIEGVSKDRLLAQAVLSPEISNASAAVNWAKNRMSDLSLNESVGILQESAEKVQQGDLSEMQATLVSQVRTLDMIFSNLATRAAMAQQLHHLEVNLRVAFKAQAQARATVEALNELKHPRQAIFIGQQNVADQQQVNNAIGTLTRETAIEKSENELLEATDGERMDTRTAPTAGGADSNMATMGKIDRRKDRRRKG